MATGLKRVAPAVVLLVLAAGATGCGVREESSPQAIDASDVPFGLLERAPAPEGPDADEPGNARLTVYLLGSDRLVPVVRQIARPADLAIALGTLAEGPTADEVALGLRSEVGPESPARPLPPQSDLAVVELSEAFLTGSGNQIVGLAQVVFTLTEVSGVARVQFLLDGQPVEVPRGDGVLTTEPVSRVDYAPLAPSP